MNLLQADFSPFFFTHLRFIFNGIVSPGDDRAALLSDKPVSFERGAGFYHPLCSITLNKHDNIRAFRYG